MSRLLSLLAIVALGAYTFAVADNSASLSFEFPTLEAGESDRRTLERYLRRPGTHRCDLVEFEVQKLIGLIKALDNGEFDVTNSSVRLTIFDDVLGEFQGIHFELGREREIPGPYSWGGVVKGDPQISVNFVIDRLRIATMILNTGEFVYRTRVSRSSGHYFMCKTDVTQQAERLN